MYHLWSIFLLILINACSYSSFTHQCCIIIHSMNIPQFTLSMILQMGIWFICLEALGLNYKIRINAGTKLVGMESFLLCTLISPLYPLSRVKTDRKSPFAEWIFPNHPLKTRPSSFLIYASHNSPRLCLLSTYTVSITARFYHQGLEIVTLFQYILVSDVSPFITSSSKFSKKNYILCIIFRWTRRNSFYLPQKLRSSNSIRYTKVVYHL